MTRIKENRQQAEALLQSLRAGQMYTNSWGYPDFKTGATDLIATALAEAAETARGEERAKFSSYGAWAGSSEVLDTPRTAQQSEAVIAKALGNNLTVVGED